MTVTEAAASLRRRDVSSVELTRQCLERCAQLDSQLRAFITITGEQALADAAERDAELASGRDRGPLHGIPIAHKDLFMTRGVRTTGGSLLYADLVPSYDAAVVERLHSAGAVTVGKTNLHELAYGITSSNPHFGAVRNPHDPERIAGGSSGGSAVAVASGMALAATGTDTGGSIRIPAAFCGIVGLKPTFGLVSRYGVLPLGFSLDHSGPMTSTVRDAALLLQEMAGFDSRDPGSRAAPAVNYTESLGRSLEGVRVGLPTKFFLDQAAPEAADAVREMARRASDAGARIEEVLLPEIDALNVVARMVLLAEASAVHEPSMADRSRFGPDVLALLDQGRLLRAVDYLQAQRLRHSLNAQFEAACAGVDCLFTPATPFGAPLVGALTEMVNGKPDDIRLATTRLARCANLLGWPALAIPAGLTSSGLPLGLQILGKPFEEPLLLRVGAAIEHGIRPIS